MNTKKIISLAAALLLCVSVLCACGGGSSAGKSIDLDSVKSGVEQLNLMGSSVDADDDMLNSVFSVDSTKLEKKLIVFPLINVQSSSYWLVLPKEGEKDAVKDQINAYMTTYEKTWEQYLPDQYQLVKDRTETEIVTDEGTWLVYIISENNDAILKVIEDSIVK